MSSLDVSTDLAIDPSLKAENLHHSFMVAKVVGRILYLLGSHFFENHPLQALYFAHLIVDANGVLVLLKFVNQDFSVLMKENRLGEKGPTII